MIRGNALAVLFFAALPVLVAQAAPPSVEARTERRVVFLEDAEPMTPSFRETLRELLGRLSLGLVQGAGSNPDGVLARVRVSSIPGGVRVSVWRGASGPLFVERDLVSGDPPAVLAETAAHIVLGAVEPLAQAEPRTSASSAVSSAPPSSASSAAPPVSASAASSAEPPGSTQPVPSPYAKGDSRESPDKALLVFGARGTARVLSAERVGVGGGARLALRLPGSHGVTVGIEAERLGAREVEFRAGRVALEVWSLRGTVQGSVASWGRWSLEPGGAVGGDRFLVEPQDIPPPAQVTKGNRWQPVVGGFFGVRARISASIALVANAGVDLDLAPRRWVALRGTEEISLFATARFRPFLTLGLELAPLRIEGAP